MDIKINDGLFLGQEFYRFYGSTKVVGKMVIIGASVLADNGIELVISYKGFVVNHNRNSVSREIITINRDTTAEQLTGLDLYLSKDLAIQAYIKSREQEITSINEDLNKVRALLSKPIGTDKLEPEPPKEIFLN